MKKIKVSLTNDYYMKIEDYCKRNSLDIDITIQKIIENSIDKCIKQEIEQEGVLHDKVGIGEIF